MGLSTLRIWIPKSRYLYHPLGVNYWLFESYCHKLNKAHTHELSTVFDFFLETKSQKSENTQELGALIKSRKGGPL